MIKVGDKVRLEGWTGVFDGLTCLPEMRDIIGTVQIVEDFESRTVNGKPAPHLKSAAIVAGWGWPVDKLELVNSPS